MYISNFSCNIMNFATSRSVTRSGLLAPLPGVESGREVPEVATEETAKG